MSGGHFDYRQYQIHEMAETIERLIETNDELPPLPASYCYALFFSN